MAASSYIQSSFLGGEWSPLSQGKVDSPEYKRAMNVCRNSYPTEEGSWTRRSGTRLGGPTYRGNPGRLISFDFEESTPYYLEFTDGIMRMWASAPQSSGLLNPLVTDFRLVTTNDNQRVTTVSTADPAVVTTGTHGWSTGDQVTFLFDSSISGSFVPLLRNRLFTITVTGTTTFSIKDSVSGVSIDGSTLGWSAPLPGTVVVARVLALVTPYTSSAWATIRKVQAEKQAVLLSGTIPPNNLQVNNLPSATNFATFSLNQISFKDGPYLDPPTDGSILTPSVSVPTSGALPVTQGWNLLTANGTNFLAASTSSTTAATSTDGVTWTSRTLNFAPVALTANGTIFVALGSGTQAATSADGITWTNRTLADSATWGAVAWNGSIFCAMGVDGSGNVLSNTSADGITWTSHSTGLLASAVTSIGWNGTAFVMGTSNLVAPAIANLYRSTDGIVWTAISIPVFIGAFCIGVNGTIFAAIVSNSDVVLASSDSGLTWAQSQMPAIAAWKAVAGNGTVFCAVAGGLGSDATSSNGVTWTPHALPTTAAWTAIAWNGSTFCLLSADFLTSYTSATGVFITVTLVASSAASINSGSGFLSTDVGRQIRLHSEPLLWVSTTTYSAGADVKYNGAYYVSLQGTNTGKPPDVSPTFWAISTAIAPWTWGTILTVTSPTKVTISIEGADLLYPTTFIMEWRLGVYSDTTGYPTCGVYYEGRLWLSGAVPNRADASKPNDIFNMAPTESDGTVTDASAISYTFNSDGVNPIFWMIGQTAGILAGTQAGEWLIAAPTAGPITATNIHAFQMTHYGSSNVEPEATQLTVSFVQRFNRTLLECFPDALSGKYTAPNLTETGKHLTTTGLAEIRYQQELLPIIWARCEDGSLVGATYERDSLFSSQPAKFIGWHRHDFENGNLVESIAVGPSADGTVDTLAMIHNEGDVHHVEFMQTMFKVNDAITDGWFVDDGIVPSGGSISGTTLTLYGLWYLNGETVSVTVGGVDCGDTTVSNGSVSVPINNDPDNLLTSAYLQTLVGGNYGIMATRIDNIGLVPAVVGFTYTSQGQLVRPDSVEQSRSPLGPALGKMRRVHQFSALLHRTQGISFGTNFDDLKIGNFRFPGGVAYTALQLFSGVHQDTLDDDSSMDGMICWEVSRPYPATVVSIAGYMQTQER